jgi:predicted permease
MRALRAWFTRLGELIYKQRRDLELTAEMESHLLMHIEDGVRAGLTPEEARRQAVIALGGVEQTKENYRDHRGFPVLEAVVQDLRFGLRMLRKNPGFTAVAILTLALGIGANTAIFSAVDAVLLEPLPYKDPSRLVFLWSTMISMGVPTSGSAAPDFREWRDRNTVFTGVAAFNYKDFDLSAPGEEPSRLQGATVTPNLFPLLGINPAIGRDFLPDEEQWGRHQVLLLSYGLWQTQFGGDKKVLGRAISLDGQDYTIVGVMPKGMPFFNDLPPVDLWVPLAYAPGDLMNTRDNHYLEIVARLKRTTPVEQAQAESSGIAEQLEREFPENKGIGAKIVTAREQLVGNVRPAMLILLAAVAFVLLIGCVNVANLMLARATAREQEFAVRSALGASRKRLLAQLLLESIPIAFFGGLVGIGFATWAIKAFESLIPSDLPRFNPISINTGVLIFTAAISLLTTALFAIVPASHASKANVEEALREGGRSGHDGRSRQRLRSLLVVSEVALALLLLIGAGLLIKTFGALRHVDPGFSPDHVLTGRLPLSPTQFPSGHENQAIEFFQQFIARVESLPGVKGVGMTSFLPLGPGGNWGKFVQIQGRTPPTSLDKVPIVRIQLSTAGYMPTIRARLLQGRFFTEQDNQQAPGVAIINETFARQFFRDESPIDKSIRMLPPINLLTPEVRERASQAPWRTVVGVIADVKDSAMNQPVQPTVYAPLLQGTSEGYLAGLVSMRFTVRTTGDPLSLVAAVRDEVHSLLPSQPVAAVATMDQLVGGSLSAARFSMLLLSIFAGIALVLSAIGIYGVMAYTVVQRTHEIGVRAALGAERGEILRWVLAQGARLALIGVATGLAAALGLTRLMRTLLYGVRPTDRLTFVGVAILLTGVALLACYIPARRAIRVDPAVALRHE